ncbi:hypothetical protein FIBSPDRAFT_936849 [Athelia psychrophila]|uniref:Uncharacterized protein n=1 Tax=Athelia psychrophila TaxID=1759441 RepID=A0A166BFQ9_9AGAM|nr:hypothetical protein FIBSPDRAFT_936849 [Fibularhizoctonia sp. CBS 109695]
MNETWNAAPDTGAARLLSPITPVPRQTPLPSNAAVLCTRLYRNDAIREAADLNYGEFKQMIGIQSIARRLARENLDTYTHWVKQSQTDQQNFLKAACNQFPLLDEYEGCWPITLYISRYLEHTSRWRPVSPPRDAAPLVLKPERIRHLSDPARSSGGDFKKATTLTKEKCAALAHILKRLANKHLEVGLSYLFQDEDQMRRVHRMAIREMPLLATQFEEAWPIKAYLTRYLRKKVSDTDTENLHRARAEEWGSKDRNVQKSGYQHGGSERWGDQAENDLDLASLRGDSPSQAWDRDNQSQFSSTIVGQNDSLKPLPSPPRRRMPNPPVAGPSRSAPVQDFLRSLQPSMEHYLPLFLSWGIQDEAALLSLKQWSSEEQDSFFAEKFSRFQIYAIKNGLHTLNSRSLYSALLQLSMRSVNRYGSKLNLSVWYPGAPTLPLVDKGFRSRLGGAHSLGAPPLARGTAGRMRSGHFRDDDGPSSLGALQTIHSPHRAGPHILRGKRPCDGHDESVGWSERGPYASTGNGWGDASSSAEIAPIAFAIGALHMPRPSNAAQLYNKYSRNHAIRDAADLDDDEFLQMVFLARSLAYQKLNIHAKWAKQSETAKLEFLQAARKRLPFLDEYEDAWPLTIYIRKYLERDRRRSGPLLERKSEPELKRRTRRQVSMLAREAMPKPLYFKNLSDFTRSSGTDFMKATRLDKEKCTTLVGILQRLANKHLQIGLPYSSQDEEEMCLVHDLAIREIPYLATQFEGAWPIKVYLARYLRKKEADINAEKSRQVFTEEWHNEDRSDREPDDQDAGSERRDDQKWGSLGGGSRAPENHRTRFASPISVRNNSYQRTPGPSRQAIPSIPGSAGNQSRFTSTTVVRSKSPDIVHTSDVPPRRPMSNPPVAGSARSASVQQFLGSLQPSLEKYLPLFLSWGIHDESALLSLRRWSPEEQYRFLHEKFSKFQIYVIKNGLDAL